MYSTPTERFNYTSTILRVFHVCCLDDFESVSCMLPASNPSCLMDRMSDLYFDAELRRFNQSTKQVFKRQHLDNVSIVISDPLAVIYLKRKDGTLEELGRTEVIMNTLDPLWITKLKITYQFEIVQPLLFRIYDVDTRYHNIPVKTLKLNEQDYLGEASCTLSEIVTKKNRSLTLNLQDQSSPVGRKDLGNITIVAEETVSSRSVVEMVLRGSNLKNKDVFSKSDPFLRISRVVEGGGAIPICKTEDNPLVIECYDFNSSGKHELIGKLEKTAAELELLYKEKTGANFYVPSSAGHDRKKVLKSQLFVDRFIETTQYTFIDYISSGFELNFMVAVDFTASNGDPRMPSSLHYIDPTGRFNAYQQAIHEVGDVIQFYDADRRFPAWGFGGKPAYGPVSHCFNLNGRTDVYEVEGVNGILSAYASALHNVSLSGPTLFGPVINMAAQSASSSLSFNINKYFVLLIITDGVITDLQGTIDSLVKASDLPLSVMIVGVGDADFKEMEILDADNGKRLESSSGRVATRDIVQFVSLRDTHRGQIPVVQSLLEELPGQFLTYMHSRGIKPLFVQEEAQAPNFGG
ncbi:unnamed protein product [Spirodela intermedia]|uniref:Uncharacterized protein n=1 Tax=Spirodela intermedia TaxID=51605 RepID=A0A7I8JHP0_SPIIN|nr:unnamed protein product [Spirodela intermedia]CAA6669063.1 unnamed protein product [Spirodela intermedia]